MKTVIREFKLTTEENPLMRNKISLVHKSQTVSDRHTVLLRVLKGQKMCTNYIQFSKILHLTLLCDCTKKAGFYHFHGSKEK